MAALLRVADEVGLAPSLWDALLNGSQVQIFVEAGFVRSP